MDRCKSSQHTAQTRFASQSDAFAPPGRSGSSSGGGGETAKSLPLTLNHLDLYIRILLLLSDHKPLDGIGVGLEDDVAAGGTVFKGRKVDEELGV